MVFSHKRPMQTFTPSRLKYYPIDKRKRKTTKANIHVTIEQQSRIDYLPKQNWSLVFIYSMYLKRLRASTQTLIFQPTRTEINFNTLLRVVWTDTERGVLLGLPKSAICVQRFDDSLNSAIRITYRISLRSSSLREPRYPLLRVVILTFK